MTVWQVQFDFLASQSDEFGRVGLFGNFCEGFEYFKRLFGILFLGFKTSMAHLEYVITKLLLRF